MMMMMMLLLNMWSAANNACNLPKKK